MLHRRTAVLEMVEVVRFRAGQERQMISAMGDCGAEYGHYVPEQQGSCCA